MVAKRRIAIIPARGGSKRVPRKNIKDFNGKPMIVWTIEAAIDSKQFDKVFVSTDDEEIAELSRKAGAEVPFLRDEYADDFSTVSDVTVYTLRKIEEKFNESFDVVVQLMANCPLRTSSSIVDSLVNFENKNSQFQISCFSYGWSNPWWASKLNSVGEPTKLFPDQSKMRSQDLEELYCPTGAIWIANVKSLLSSNTFYGPGHRFYPVSWIEAVDIDTMEDWESAKILSAGMRAINH